MSAEKFSFTIPNSQLRKKAVSLGISEEVYSKLLHKQQVYCLKSKSFQRLSRREVDNAVREIFHPTKMEEKQDEFYCKELLEKGVDFEELQEGLSSISLFRDFLSSEGCVSTR
ncbi:MULTISPECIES: hypothetical protein [Bacteroides]|uniref:hypothetical protein n=1 Tax=Bacteroides TaxID=816 RepID=UPI000E433589|nr:MULTISPECIES: hypothetical protein [Bacteroides]MBS7574755.1 hypothetical protein [Bacteroides propionicigenes]RGM29117.1 hypothetical protein DXC20_05235 [Bacteroides sp. OM08-17BH]HBO05368.1 hypothetical protein [Bacteroides sp.]